MARGWGEELREQGRGVVGALLVVGVTFLYTMETWWWGWTLPTTHLLVYALGGLAIVLAVTRQVSFREDERKPESDGRTEADGAGVRGEQAATDGDGNWTGPIRQTLFDFAELVLQSFVAAYVVLLTFGVVELGDPWRIVARLGLVEVVPLSFGAALANELLTGSKSPTQRSMAANVATYGIGAVFVAGGISPTQEMELIASHMGRVGAPVLVALSLIVSYLILYELDFQGQEYRLRGRRAHRQIGQAFIAYGVAVVVGTGLLAAFGHFINTSDSVAIQMIVIVSFPTAIGASAAQVVIG
jgi:uncharacterized membrane protein